MLKLIMLPLFLQHQESTSPLQVSPGSPTQPGLSLAFHPLRFPEGEEQTLPGESFLSEDSNRFSDQPSPQDQDCHSAVPGETSGPLPPPAACACSVRERGLGPLIISMKIRVPLMPSRTVAISKTDGVAALQSFLC